MVANTIPEVEITGDKIDSFRRQVSDLGMEDPIAVKHRQVRKLDKSQVENNSIEDIPLVSDHSFSLYNDNEDDDFDMDLEELATKRNARCSLRSSSSGSKGGSMALKAMHESFNNSMSFSFTDDLNLGDAEDDRNEGKESPVAQHKKQHPAGEPRRKLPARAGSGYVRGVTERVTDSPGNRRSLRSSINARAVPGTALLKQKRNSATQNIQERAIRLNSR